MRLYTSNRAEDLVSQLAEVVRRPSGSPFDPELVLVHSPGMGAWLTQRVAEQVGICANVRFPFPHHFIPELLREVLGEQADGVDKWTRSRLQWAVVAELLARWRDPEFAAVRHYLRAGEDGSPNYLRAGSGGAEDYLRAGSGGGDGDYLRAGGDEVPNALKTMQLAARIARVFTGYLYYRPAMIERWQRFGAVGAEDDNERWQALLWAGVRQRMGAPNVVELAERFRTAVDALADAGPDAAKKRKTRPAPRVDQLALDFEAVTDDAGAHAAGDVPAPGRSGSGGDGGGGDGSGKGGNGNGNGLPRLPARVCLFGVSSLPPLQLGIFGALARLIDVELFVLSPSSQFFAEIRDARSIARARRRDVTEADEHLEIGNPLLASLGRLGRDFQHLLYDADLPVVLHAESFVDPMAPPVEDGSAERQASMFPPRATALQVLQADVLELRHRGHGAPDAPEYVAPYALDDDDRSVAIHSCHGPMRQVEVLHDQLLDLFRRDATLTPADIVVMCPDLESYGPLVEAVFDRGPEDTRNIPFRIADRSLRRDSPVAEAFLAMLQLVDGRFGAPDVMDLLSMPLVHRRFGIAADELPRVAEWIRETGIRWGIDPAHRETHGQPPYGENTWRFGLDRMLIGAALPSDGSALFAGVLPFDPIEGQAAATVGRVAEFCTTLFAQCARLRADRSLGEWRDALGEALAALVATDDESSWQHEQIRRFLAQATDEATTAGVDQAFPLVAVRNMLRDELTEGRSSYGFVTGSVTFCEMLPMRAIPFRVVVMLGMDERSFPRGTSRLRFDLVSRTTARGDRSPRDDDRYLFLEALLSARDRVLITFTGQSVRDNATLPPAVVVSELLDVCVESFSAPPGRFVTRHALQPFSERYFRADDPLFTYAHEFHSGAESLRAPVEPRRPFVTRPAPLEAPVEAVSVEEFVRFYRDPVRYFFQRRLDVYLEEESVALLDREPIVLDRKDSSILAGRMLERAVEGHALDRSYPITRAEGVLPLGRPGEAKHEALVGRVAPLDEAVAELRGGVPGEAVLVDVEVDGVRVAGRVRNVFGGRLVHHQYSRVRGDHELVFWVRHLLVCAAGIHSESVMIGRPSTHSASVRHGSRGLDVHVTRFRPPDDALAILRVLVGLFQAGLEEPLLLFPRTAIVWQELETERDRWRETYTAWKGRMGMFPGERDAPYNAVLIGGDLAPFERDFGQGEHPVLGALPSRPELDFKNLAATVFGPLLAHRQP